MKVVIIGAGPTGLTLGATLARRGHEVTAIDRDGGPAANGSWQRIGVMQFHHAHGFRAQVPELLQAEWPEAQDAWDQLGAEHIVLDLPGGASVIGVRSRRITYERALRTAARDVRGLTVATGSVSELVEYDGEVRGVVVDGRRVLADLVVDASGRGLADTIGTTEMGGDCGISYVGRIYRRHTGTEPGPLNNPISWGGNFDGYQAIVFPHDHHHFSAVIVRPTADTTLGELRHVHAFEAATQAIPGMREWTHPGRSSPTSSVMLGGRPRNVYRSQRRIAGLVAVGDAIATTTPTAGRGIALASMQIRSLLGLFDAGIHPRRIADPFADWCDTQIRPWVEEHIARDDEAIRRMGGEDLDLSRALTTTSIVDAAQVEARIIPHLAGYLAMTELPSSLAPAEPFARAVYEAGWRPALSDGPTRIELRAAVHSHRGHRARPLHAELHGGTNRDSHLRTRRS